MAKPICVIYYNPEMIGDVSGKIPSLLEMNEAMEKKFPDYFTLALPSFRSNEDSSIDDIRLQVFHEKDFTEIQYQELKNLLKMLSQKNNQ